MHAGQERNWFMKIRILEIGFEHKDDKFISCNNFLRNNCTHSNLHFETFTRAFSKHLRM